MEAVGNSSEISGKIQGITSYDEENSMIENKNKNNHYNKQNLKKFKPKDKIQKIDPFTVQQIIYQAEMYILLRYPHLIGLNQKNEGISNSLNPLSNFIMIKSLYEEDIHKAIKYNVWSSTKYGNTLLNDKFNSAIETNSEVYLFFACDSSRQFLGVAKLISGIDSAKVFPLWTRDNKQPGLFGIEWLFIKDVPFFVCKDINAATKDGNGKPIHLFKNTQVMQFVEGKKLMERIESYNNTNTILEHFEYYDIRQENYERMFPINK